MNFIKRGYLAAKAKAVQLYEDGKKVVVAVVTAVGVSLGAMNPVDSFAAGPDLSTVTTAVDFGTVTTAVLGVAAALIVVYIAWKGAKMVISAVRGG